MDAQSGAAAAQFHGKRVLRQDLPAGKGDPAAGIAIKKHILLDAHKDLVQAVFAPGHKQGFAGTGSGASAAGVAQGPVETRRAGLRAYGPARAEIRAAAAAQAIVSLLQQLPPRILGGGVGAPAATQRAALEKNRGPDARPVMQAVVLDISIRAFMAAPTEQGCRTLPGAGPAGIQLGQFHAGPALHVPGALQKHVHDPHGSPQGKQPAHGAGDRPRAGSTAFSGRQGRRPRPRPYPLLTQPGQMVVTLTAPAESSR